MTQEFVNHKAFIRSSIVPRVRLSPHEAISPPAPGTKWPLLPSFSVGALFS